MSNQKAISRAPQMMTDAFLMRAIPKACLHEPEDVNLPPIEHPTPTAWKGQRRLNMSVENFMSKARIHKSAFIRRTIISRIHAAFAMIITRGADCEVNHKGEDVLVLREKDIGDHWISQGMYRGVQSLRRSPRALRLDVRSFAQARGVQNALAHTCQMREKSVSPHPEGDETPRDTVERTENTENFVAKCCAQPSCFSKDFPI